ncbi:MAG: hypothetical protein U9R41_03500 [Candidatus Marinimicrobia bacterium]|nr:hypothetical protein [Candidatus Neomarinimicrobiota bacterium]
MNKKHPHLKNSIFDFALIAFSISILFLIEYFLQLVGFGESYPLANIVEKNNVKYYMVNENFPKKYFSNNIQNYPKFRKSFFKVKKDSNDFRIFVVGGNIVNGVPYDESINFSSIFKYLTKKYNRNIDLEIIDLSINSINSYGVKDIIKYLPKYKPDLLILNTGYNEFFGIPNSSKINNFHLEYFFTKSFIFFRKFRIYQLTEKIVNFFQEQNVDKINYLQADYYDNRVDYKSGKYINKRKNFLRNLYKIEDITNRYHIPVIISNLSANISSIPPFHSEFNDEELTDIELYRNFPNYLIQDDKTQAEDWLQDLKSWEPQSAIYYYCKAILDKKNNQIESSLKNYTIAIRIDKFHFRPLQDWNFAIKNFANEKEWMFVNIDSVYDDLTFHKLKCDNIFIDHIHPNIKGYWLFVKEHFNVIEKNKLFSIKKNNKLSFNEFTKKYPLTNFTKSNQAVYAKAIRKLIYGNNIYKDEYLAQGSIVKKFAYQNINKNISWLKANEELLDHYYKKGDDQEALKYFKNIQTTYSYNLKNYLKGILIYYENEQWRKIIQLKEESSGTFEHAKLFYYYGVAYYQIENYERSFNCFKRAEILLETNPHQLSDSEKTKLYKYYGKSLEKIGKIE